MFLTNGNIQYRQLSSIYSANVNQRKCYPASHGNERSSDSKEASPKWRCTNEEGNSYDPADERINSSAANFQQKDVVREAGSTHTIGNAISWHRAAEFLAFEYIFQVFILPRGEVLPTQWQRFKYQNSTGSRRTPSPSPTPCPKSCCPHAWHEARRIRTIRTCAAENRTIKLFAERFAEAIIVWWATIGHRKDAAIWTMRTTGPQCGYSPRALPCT